MKLNDEIKLPPRLATGLRIGLYGCAGLVLSVFLRIVATGPPEPQRRPLGPVPSVEEGIRFMVETDATVTAAGRTPTPTPTPTPNPNPNPVG
jgi:hypothetical protein